MGVMMKLVNVIYFVLISFILMSAQTLSYDVKALGMKVGSMKITRTLSGSNILYQIESTNHVSYLFGEIDVKHSSSASFLNGVLQKSNSKTDKNGKLESSCETVLSGSVYKIKTHQTIAVYSSPIRYSIFSMYYNEPKGLKEIFSEEYGKMVPISEVKPHRFMVSFPDGKKYHYDFENGVISDVEVPSAVGTVHMRLKK
jgi:hypothetical protein